MDSLPKYRQPARTASSPTPTLARNLIANAIANRIIGVAIIINIIAGGIVGAARTNIIVNIGLRSLAR
eukprot:3820126-Lingulodinium_polyedra.AAC.1